jgi:hypothetical protein
MLLFVAVGGCAWKGEGIVTRAGQSAVLTTSTDDRYALRVDDDQEGGRLLVQLDGHLVALTGKKLGKRVRVDEWSIVTGLHGMNVWIGRLERQGNQLGLLDHNSKAFYVVSRDAREELAPFVGQDVLLEGYVQGAHEVSVLHYEVFVSGRGD